MEDIFKKENLTTKEKIMMASIMEFGELGLAGSRVDKIAETAGVNKAMIYYHFNSKENLYHEVIQHHIKQIAFALRENIDKKNSLEEILNRVADVYASIFTFNQYIRQIVIRELALPESDIIKMIADTIQSSEFPQIIASKLNEGMEQNQIRQIDIRQAIVSFITMNVGYFIMSPIVNRIQQVKDPKQFIAQRKYAVVDLFLNGVLKK